MERFRVATRFQYVTYFQDFHKCFNCKLVENISIFFARFYCIKNSATLVLYSKIFSL